MRIIFDEDNVRGEVNIHRDGNIQTYLNAYIGALFTEGFTAEVIQQGLEYSLKNMQPTDKEDIYRRIMTEK